MNQVIAHKTSAVATILLLVFCPCFLFPQSSYWKRVGDLSPTASAVSSSGSTVFVSSTGGIYTSTNGGDRWTWIPSSGLSGIRLTSISQFPSGALYAGSTSTWGIFSSADGGLNWGRKGVTGYQIEQVDYGRVPYGVPTILARTSLTSPQAFISADNGVHWDPVSLGPSSRYYDMTRGAAYDIWCAGSDGVNVFTRGQATLQGNSIFSIAFTWNELWAAGCENSTGSGRIYLSLDSGKTWQTTEFRGDTVRCIAVSGGGKVYALTGGRVLHSSDDGRTWKSHDSSFHATQIECGEDGYIYAISSGMVFRSLAQCDLKGQLQLERNSLDFGSVELYETKWDSVYLWNSGPGWLELDSVKLEDSYHFKAYLAKNGLGPGEGTYAKIGFESSGSVYTGSWSTSIYFHHSGSDSIDTLLVTGRPTTELFLPSATQLAFGNVHVGERQTQVLLVSSPYLDGIKPGGGAATSFDIDSIVSSSREFVVTPQTAHVTVDGFPFEVHYTPQVGASDGILVFYQHQYLPDTILASGNGILHEGEYVTDSNTTLLLHFNEASPQYVVDLSGAARLSVVQGTELASGKLGSARSFRQSSDDMITLKDRLSTSARSMFTLESWFHLVPGGSERMTMLCKGDSSGNWSYAFGVVDTLGSIRPFADLALGGATCNLVGMDTAKRNLWNHIAISFDGSTARLFLNGKLSAFAEMTGQVDHDTADLCIGGKPNSHESDYFGLLDELRISSVARAPEEFNLSVPPRQVQVFNPSRDTVVLQWGRNLQSSFVRYKIYCDTVQAPSHIIDSSIASEFDTVKVLSGLDIGKTYYMHVTAVTSVYGESYPSNEVSIRPWDWIRPDTVRNLRVTGHALNTVSLAWNPNSDQDLRRYRIYWDTKPNPAILRDSTDLASFMCDTLQNGIRYYFRVAAVDSYDNEGPMSNERSAVPQDVVLPDSVHGLTVSDSSSSHMITLRWEHVGDLDLDYYELLYDSLPAPTRFRDTTRLDSMVVAGLRDSTRYYFRVRAVDLTGNLGPYSGEVNAMPWDRRPPAEVVALRITDSTSHTVRLQWTPNTEPDLSCYMVLWDTLADSKRWHTLVPRDSSSATFDTLWNGTRYRFQLVAVDSAGNSSTPSTEVNARPWDRIKPFPPQEFSIFDSSSHTIGISWQKSPEPDVVRYKIYRGTAHPLIPRDSTTSREQTSLKMYDVQNKTRYYLYVTAVDECDNESDPSTERDAMPADRTPPEAPALVLDTAYAQTIIVSWTSNSSDVDSFQFFMDLSPNPTNSSGKVAGNARSKTFRELTNGATYYIAMIAIDIAGNQSPRSNEIFAVPRPPQLDPPSLLAPTPNAKGRPLADTLKWTAVENADLYRYVVALDTGFASIAFAETLSATSKLLTSLTRGTQYYWHVSGLATLVPGPWSETRAFETGDVPASPTLVSPSNNLTGLNRSVTFQWNAVSNVKSYRLQLSLRPGFDYLAVNDSVLTATSRTVNDLANNAQYFWRVTAKNDFGEGLPSALRTFQTMASDSILTSITYTFPSRSTAQSTDYRLVSIPGVVDTIPLGNFFGGSSGAVGDWRAYRDAWDRGNSYQELSGQSTIATGEGFWFIRETSQSFAPRKGLMPSVDSSGNVIIPIHREWNIIANPLHIPVPWSRIALANNVSGVDLWDYSGAGGYVAATNMIPYKGYYFFNQDSTRTTLKIPYPFPALPKLVDPTLPFDWRIQLTLESGGMTDALNFVGVLPASQDGIDQYDSRKPPNFSNQPTVILSEREVVGGSERFASDYRPQLGDGQVWDFDICDAKEGVCRLSISGLEAIPSTYRIVLINLLNTNPIDLRGRASVEVPVFGSRMKFKLVVGTTTMVERIVNSLIPKEFALLQNYPNPFNPTTAISFALPQRSRVGLTIYSVLGREVYRVFEEEREPGLHTILWPGIDQQGVLAASGTYICRMIVNGNPRQAIKMLLLK